MQAGIREEINWCEISASNCIEPALEPLYENAASGRR